MSKESKGLAVRENNGELAPAMQNIQAIAQEADMYVKSGLFPPEIKTWQQAAVIMLKGSELGLPKTVALSHINVVRGKAQPDTQLMIALCHKKIPGFRFDVIESTDKKAVVEAQRPGGKPFRCTYTWDDAVRAGNASLQTYKQHPMMMLMYRAASTCLKVVAPDAILGLALPGEEFVPTVYGDDAEVATVTPGVPDEQTDAQLANIHIEADRVFGDLEDEENRVRYEDFLESMTSERSAAYLDFEQSRKVIDRLRAMDSKEKRETMAQKFAAVQDGDYGDTTCVTVKPEAVDGELVMEEPTPKELRNQIRLLAKDLNMTPQEFTQYVQEWTCGDYEFAEIPIQGLIDMREALIKKASAA